MSLRYLVVASEPDPVARAVLERWGRRDALDLRVEGTPIRRLAPDVGLLHRSTLHIHDDGLEGSLPASLHGLPIVFPSIHRSERGVECTTVHPLGNFGDSAEVGGAPRTLVPAPARLMTDALRRLAEGGSRSALPPTFEATHHGPALRRPACFVEIGHDPGRDPPAEAVSVLASLLTELVEDPADDVVVGVGGGHYVPHFTDLALARRWAFGHFVPRHVLETEGRAAVVAAASATPGVQGVLYARAQDAEKIGTIEGVRRRRDSEAERWGPRGSPSSSPAAGT